MEAASQTGLKVALEVLNWIENNFPRDMHTMSNLLHSLDRYAMSAKRAVTIPDQRMARTQSRYKGRSVKYAFLI